MIRRTFLQLAIAALITPKIILAEKVDKIIEFKVETIFDLEPIFTQGDLRIYEPINPYVIHKLEIKFESGKIEKYTADTKIFISRYDFNNPNTKVIYEPVVCRAKSGKHEFEITSVKLTNDAFCFSTQECSCCMSGLRKI